MQKYWIESFYRDWADEFDVYFFDIYTDRERNNVNWLGEKFPNLKIPYCFGTNEYWEDYDGFKFKVEGIEATEDEINILKKFGISGESLGSAYIDWVWDHMNKDIYKKWCNKYGSILNVPEDVFQTYPFELTKDDYCEKDGNI